MHTPFDIPELHEAILLELPIEDLILVTSISKTWRATICGSIKIRKRLLIWRKLSPAQAMFRFSSSASRPKQAKFTDMSLSPLIQVKMRLFHVEHPQGTFIVLRRHKTEVTLLLPTDIRKGRLLVLPRQLKKVIRVVTWSKQTGYSNKTAYWYVKWYGENGLFIGNRSYSDGAFARYFDKYYWDVQALRSTEPPKVIKKVLNRVSGRGRPQQLAGCFTDH
ncbi:hypothetical protein DOTSEDRAFT_30918 [Dothistroma septosporum NZE10]|uniref:F-box domain-containing protein n=1 Tax=Dothistroma septosporum (strain NZE10 / CBS 128990) TaxID=675120 RepID=N1Q4U8_DOTSN|nr:hypothetical protein DOTSEDRAFT_30918 [Dothistroma septosporum NZE10]